MEERTGDEYIGKPTPKPPPKARLRRRHLDVGQTDIGAMRTRGGEWADIAPKDEKQDDDSCRESATHPERG